MKLEKFQEQVFFSTVRIALSGGTGVGQSIGTGFLVSVVFPGSKDQFVTLLVSNRHVFGQKGQSLTLFFHKLNGAKTGPLLGQVVTFHDGQFSGPHWAHTDQEIDLACQNVSIIMKSKYNIYHTHLLLDHFADFGEDDLLPGKEVWFVGYPENRFDTAHNLPLLRKGHIASIPTIDFNSQKQFVIDAQVFRGSSGSPVFSILGDRFKFLGLLTQAMIKHQTLQAVPTSTAVGVEQMIGLGIVIKAPAVKELIDHSLVKITQALGKKLT